MFNVYDESQASQLFKEIGLLTVMDCEALISLKGSLNEVRNDSTMYVCLCCYTRVV